jgi:hypothetical protein
MGHAFRLEAVKDVGDVPKAQLGSISIRQAICIPEIEAQACDRLLPESGVERLDEEPRQIKKA